MKRLLFGAALVCVISAPLLAAGKESSAIILNEPAVAPSVASAEAWVPNLGDSVTFTSIFPSSLASRSVSIQVLCYQNGALVFATAGLYERSFLLGGSVSPWLQTGGDATCHADLYYWSTNGQKFNQLASTEFPAAGY